MRENERENKRVSRSKLENSKKALTGVVERIIM